MNNSLKKDSIKFQNKDYYYNGIIQDKGMEHFKTFSVPILFLLSFFSLHIPRHHNGFMFYFLTIIAIGISFYALQNNVLPLVNNYRSKKWKKTVANVQYSRIWKYFISTGEGMFIEYFPYIKYTYIIKNRLYKNDNLSFEAYYINNYTLNPKKSNDKSLAHNFFQDAVKNQKVMILFNPKNPKESVIIRDIHPFRYLFYFLLSLYYFYVFVMNFISLFNFIVPQ